MARKFGQKVDVKTDPLSYNIGLIGESGIGKSTIMKELCEKLVGEDGYISLNIGKEDGHEAIQGIVSEDVPDWDTFVKITNDIVENKITDYKDLRVVIIDTIDQLFEIAEPHVIKLHNRQVITSNKKDKSQVSSINAAFGGFGAGLDKAIELVQDRLWELKKVGVSFIVVGHTKKRDIDDPVSGESYSILTTNISQRYFNAIKTKLHFLGVAHVDREIIKENTGKKNFKTGEEIKKGKVTGETRVIKFRDDNFSVDSKSRFADIIDSIPFNTDALINALQDAIENERAKSGKTFAETKKAEVAKGKVKEKQAEEYIETKKQKAQQEELEEQREEYLTVIQDNFADCDAETKKKAKELLAETGCKKFSDADIPIDVLKQIAEVVG